jgi:hypothetical protein
LDKVHRAGSKNRKEVENSKRVAKSNDSLTSIATHSNKGMPFMEENAAEPVNMHQLTFIHRISHRKFA